MISTYTTAREMLADLAAKRVSARELLDAHLARNDALHGKLNAIVETDIVRAMKDAAATDDARARGETLGPLAGLPMTIKDGFDVENMPATSGNPALANRPKDCADAMMVARARKAGAVIWGKSNVSFMLGDIQSHNEIYGTTNNPYDVSRVPGGSSGGAATALAAGITPLEIGSDIGGSLRHPANFCGVVSLKPTLGVLPQRGLVPPLPGEYWEDNIGVVGPMARDIEDLRLLWSVLREAPSPARKDIKGARIAIWDSEMGFPLARDVREGVMRASEALAAQGARVEHAKPDIDGFDMFMPYLTTLSATVAISMPDKLIESFEASREADKKILAEGGADFAGASQRVRMTASFREVAKAMMKQQALKDRLADFFDAGWDAILMPIAPVTAFPHMHEGSFNDRMLDVDGVPTPYLSLLMWITLATFLHAPSVAVQAGRNARGMPVGVQLVGRWHGEDRLLDLAAGLEEKFGFSPPAI
ncbi:MAG TPA: amidase family protein [Rhizomicrobium sp.]|nr:amidase family protein [Rhizomicrobium sp.]